MPKKKSPAPLRPGDEIHAYTGPGSPQKLVVQKVFPSSETFVGVSLRTGEHHILPYASPSSVTSVSYTTASDRRKLLAEARKARKLAEKDRRLGRKVLQEQRSLQKTTASHSLPSKAKHRVSRAGTTVRGYSSWLLPAVSFAGGLLLGRRTKS